MTADIHIHPSIAAGRRRMAARRGLPTGAAVVPVTAGADWRFSIFSNELDLLKAQFIAIRERLPKDHRFRADVDWSKIEQEPDNPIWMAMDKCMSLIKNVDDKLERSDPHNVEEILLLLETQVVKFDDEVTFYLAQL